MLQQQQQQPDPPILFERRPIRTAPPFTIAQLTLNRPHRGNALTPAMTHLIHTALDTIDRDPYVRMLVVTGRGRYFCTGMDLHEVGASAAASVAAAEGPVIREEGRQDEVDDADNEVPSLAMFQAMFERLHRLAVPTLCLLNGPALGGGVGLALLCDLRIATSPAHYLALTECKRGLVPALISLYVVPALPQSLVMEMMVFGERVGVLRLLQVGVFNGVVVGQRGSTSSGIGKTSGSDISTGNDTSSNDNGTHFPTVDAAMTYYTAAIATSAPQASRTIKQLVHRLNRSAIDRDDDNKQYVRAIFRAMMASEEALYGMMCFMQKEKPDWARLPVSDLEAKAKAKL